MKTPTRNGLSNEVSELEKIMSTLTRLPCLMRAGYWIVRVEQLLGRPELLMRDRQRLIDVRTQILACIDRSADADLRLAA